MVHIVKIVKSKKYCERYIKKINNNTNYTIKKNKRFHESSLLSLNIDKARKELGWKPTLSFENTMKLTSDWYSTMIKNEDLEQITEKQMIFFQKRLNTKNK